MKTKISLINRLVGNNIYRQYIEVWFSDKEFNEFKKQCNKVFNKYYAFYEIEMFINLEEQEKLANILNLYKHNDYKYKAKTIIKYHKDYEQ